MYYRSDTAGCLGCLVVVLILGSLLALLVNPYFWIAVGALVLLAIIRREVARYRYRKGGGDSADEYRADDYRGTNGGAYNGVGGSLAPEEDYTSGAIEVSEVEVISEDEEPPVDGDESSVE